MRPRRVGKKVRDTVFHLQHGKCAVCKCDLGEIFDLDHRIPWSISQDSSYTNLQALCVGCHAHKSRNEQKTIKQFMSTPFCWECKTETAVLKAGVCEACRIATTPACIIDLEKYAYNPTTGSDE